MKRETVFKATALVIGMALGFALIAVDKHKNTLEEAAVFKHIVQKYCIDAVVPAPHDPAALQPGESPPGTPSATVEYNGVGGWWIIAHDKTCADLANRMNEVNE